MGDMEEELNSLLNQVNALKRKIKAKKRNLSNSKKTNNSKPKKRKVLDHGSDSEFSEDGDMDGEVVRYALAPAPLLDYRRTRQVAWKGKTAQEGVYDVHISPNLYGAFVIDVFQELYNLFTRVLQTVRSNNNPSDLIRVFLNNDTLTHPIRVPLQRLSHISPQEIMSEVERCVQSHDALEIDRNFQIHVGIIKTRGGRGFGNISDLRNDRMSKRCIIAVKNTDDKCFARALAIAIAHKNAADNPILFKKLKNQTKYLDKEANKLHELASVEKGEVSLVDIPQFEKALNINIVVFSAASGNQLYYSSDQKKYSSTVYLYHVEIIGKYHFDCLTKPNALLNKKHFCANCKVGYDNKGRHRCKFKCFCGPENCIYTSSPIICKDCNRKCRSQACFARHKKI